MKSSEKYRVLIVCLGNICRSPAAQGVLEHLISQRGLEHIIVVDSAGTYGGHSGDLPDPRMRSHAKRRGYDLRHIARKINSWDFHDFDLIVGMDDMNVRDLKRMAATAQEQDKVVMIGKYLSRNAHYDYVPDPYYEGSEGFELVLDLLEDACQNLLYEIINIIKI